MKRAKEQAREELRTIRDGLEPDFRAEASAAICNQIEGELRRVGADVVASYVAFRSEVDLSRLHREWVDGRRLVLPRVIDDERLELVEVDAESLTRLRTGRFGILEPVGEPISLSDVDVVLVPGLGFDRAGARIGYGAGYYDRLLQRIDESKGRPVSRWGIAFSQQLVDQIPLEPHDVPLDRVITELEEK